MELRQSTGFCFTAMVAFLQIGPVFATNLVDAVRAGDVGRVELLLDSGADPNNRSPYNGPLHDAARLGSAEITTSLIQAGADVELPGFGGVHPLHSAALIPLECHFVIRGPFDVIKDRSRQPPFNKLAKVMEIVAMLLRPLKRLQFSPG